MKYKSLLKVFFLMVASVFDLLRLSMYTGRPAGVCSFVEQISNFIGRDFKNGAPGRPRKK
jgi:hypothetical protein